jgi:hypothetical protein
LKYPFLARANNKSYDRIVAARILKSGRKDMGKDCLGFIKPVEPDPSTQLEQALPLLFIGATVWASYSMPERIQTLGNNGLLDCEWIREMVGTMKESHSVSDLGFSGMQVDSIADYMKDEESQQLLEKITSKQKSKLVWILLGTLMVGGMLTQAVMLGSVQ